jgi:hypothetical protein
VRDGVWRALRSAGRLAAGLTVQGKARTSRLGNLFVLCAFLGVCGRSLDGAHTLLCDLNQSVCALFVGICYFVGGILLCGSLILLFTFNRII